MINSNWHPISELSQLILQILDTMLFWATDPNAAGLGTTYDVYLGLIGKRVLDFLLVLIELFARCYGWGATGENRSQIGDVAPARSVWREISGRRRRPQQLFLRG